MHIVAIYMLPATVNIIIIIMLMVLSVLLCMIIEPEYETCISLFYFTTENRDDFVSVHSTLVFFLKYTFSIMILKVELWMLVTL